MTVDPLAELIDDCLVVAQFADGRPHMLRWSRTGKGNDGRFIASSDSAEAFRLYPPGVLYTQSDLGTFIRMFGRVVGTPREFPRPLPASYRSIGRAAA